MNFYDWAIKWGVPVDAIKDLENCLGLDTSSNIVPISGGSEAAVQTSVRLSASRTGWRLWRNNVGALQDESGRYVRYGLANDSKAVNSMIKSGDLIGIKPVLIYPQHVGQLIGQFVSRECKHEGWEFAGSAEEIAQKNWALLINSLGGDAKFVSSREDL